MDLQSEDRELLGNIHIWLGSGEQAEYRQALLLAALDETQDLREAFELAQRADKNKKEN